MRKEYLTTLILLTIFIGAGFYLVKPPSSSSTTDVLPFKVEPLAQPSGNSSIVEDIPYGPEPFDRYATKSTYNAFVASIPSNLKIKLPTWVPNNLKSTAVYGELPGVIVITYSAQGYEAIGKSELTLQITFSDEFPFDPNFSKGTFTKIGGLDAYVDAAAGEGSSEYVALYGKTCILLVIREGNANYWLRAAPFLNLEDLIRVVNSMGLVN
jgi:hypothetical protein